MKAYVAMLLGMATCSPVLSPPLDGPTVVDAGASHGSIDVCEPACVHLITTGLVIGDRCVETCMATMGTNMGATVNWDCAAVNTDRSSLLHCLYK